MQRLTFPFPFVHHQSHDWKVEQLLTVETRTLLRESSAAVKILSLVSRFPFMKSLVAGSLSLSHGPPPIVLFMNLKPEGATVTAHEQQLEIQTKNPSLGIAAQPWAVTCWLED